MLVRSNRWAKDNFAPGSEPHYRTIKSWVEDGTLEGLIINNLVYVEETALGIKEAKRERPDNVRKFKFNI